MLANSVKHKCALQLSAKLYQSAHLQKLGGWVKIVSICLLTTSYLSSCCFFNLSFTPFKTRRRLRRLNRMCRQSCLRTRVLRPHQRQIESFPLAWSYPLLYRVVWLFCGWCEWYRWTRRWRWRCCCRTDWSHHGGTDGRRRSHIEEHHALMFFSRFQ